MGMLVRRGGIIPVCLATGLLVPNGTLEAQVSPEYEATLNRVLQRPADAEASFLFAQAAASSGNFREAISALERVLILYPDLSNIKLEIGILYLRLGQSALAEKFIREALQAPDAPPEVRARAEDLLEIAERGNDPLATSFIASAGVIADSNANSGPESGVIAEDTEQSDVSAFVRLGSRLSYDLGTQAGHQLIASFDYYGRRYSEQDQINLDRFALSGGGAFNLTPESEGLESLRLTLDAVHYRRGGEDFLTEYGPGAALGFSFGDDAAGDVSVFYREQDYINTTEISANDERDGSISGFAGSLRYALEENQLFTFGARFSEKSASVAYESYQEASLSMSYALIEDPLLPVGQGSWRYGLSAYTSLREYVGADPSPFTPNEAQTSRFYSISGSVEIPFENGASLLTEVGHSRNASNYDLNDFKNTFVSISLSRAF